MVTFLIVLSVLVLFHELGHYLAARYFGVEVESFSIGFGPRLLGFKWKGTDFKICLLPMGGYVKMAGQGLFGVPGGPNDIQAKPRWQRFIVYAAGPVFNFILAVALLAGLYTFNYERPRYVDEEPVVAYVRDDSPALAAGLRNGDVIRSLGGEPTPTWKHVALASVLAVGGPAELAFDRGGERLSTEILIPTGEDGMPVDSGWGAPHQTFLTQVELGKPAHEAGLQSGDRLLSIGGSEVLAVDHAIDLIGNSEGRSLAVMVERAGERLAMDVQPVAVDGYWRFGMHLVGRYAMIQEPRPFPEALSLSLNENYEFATLIFRGLTLLVTGGLSLNSLEGPVGIYDHTQQAKEHGLNALIQLMALISINLGVINLAPIPVLDGGNILLLSIEGLLRRDVSVAVKQTITNVGLVFILLLFGLVMYNDVTRQFFLR